MTGMSPGDGRALLAAACAALVGACFLEPDPRCGPAMHYEPARHACVCDEGAVPVAGGCARCAEDEVVVGTVCACPPGATKNADGVCAVVEGLGDPCSAQMPCTDATYDLCAPSTAGVTAGTCTKACVSNDDCDAAYTCATWEAAPYCREFSGVGKPCTSQGDCAGEDAMACDTMQTHMCLVVGCTVADDECPRGTECCDLSAFGAGTACLGACP